MFRISRFSLNHIWNKISQINSCRFFIVLAETRHKMMFSFKLIWTIEILFLIVLIHPNLGENNKSFEHLSFTTDVFIGDECVDTVGWTDRTNNFTCSDYVAIGWCVNQTIVTSLQNSSMPSLNFPDSNCCVCGKKGEYRRNFHLKR